MEKLWQPLKNNSDITEFTLFIRTTSKRAFQLVEHLIAAIIAYMSTHCMNYMEKKLMPHLKKKTKTKQKGKEETILYTPHWDH